jgi:glycosyltransferase involved in cell wall biosynthesis
MTTGVGLRHHPRNRPRHGGGVPNNLTVRHYARVMPDITPPQSDFGVDAALKVLLADASDRGGIVTYTAELRKALTSEGLDVVLAGPAGIGDEGAVLPDHRWGPEVDKLSRLALYRLRLNDIGPAVLTFLRIVAREQPDVVHVQTDVVSGIDHLVLRWIARRYPVVITAHDPVPHEGGVKELAHQARRWRTADAVIIHGTDPRELVQASAQDTPVHVVPVDLRLGGPAVDRKEARRRLGLGEHPTALLLGLLRPYKGIGLLAEAWPKVAAALPDARLLLVGDPYECPELDTLDHTPGVEVRRGFVPEEDLDLWAAAADVLVLPYRHGSHSGVLHRGLAAGTPALASPSLGEEASRTVAGRVVALDPTLWTESLIEVLGEKPLPRPPKTDGHQTARETIEVYREVLAARARKRTSFRTRRRG